MAFEAGFDAGDAQEWQVAVAFLAASAEVIVVDAAFAVCGFGVDQAAGFAAQVAALAKQQAFGEGGLARFLGHLFWGCGDLGEWSL